MKTKNLFFLCACALAFTACGGDDDPVVIKEKIPDIDNGTSANTNKNTTGPIEAQTRYEFPKLKGGKSVVIVHKANINSGDVGVNYCVEWDTNIHAQRWSCW